MTGVWNRTSRWVLAAACVLGAVGAGRGLAQSGGGGTPSPDRAALADQEYASAEAAARQNPRDAVLAVEAGGIAGDRGRHLLALTWFQKAEKLNPRLAPAITGQGQMWMALGWPGRAVAAYDRALKLAPEEPQLLLEMSRACAAQRDLDRALELAKKAQTLLPGDAHTARALAHIHAERNEMDLSLVAAQKACDLAPQDDANWTTWGQLLFRA
ncbi:MAG: hypothetical protein FJX77_03325, partial [Armatimonadetes bacterium]|nr:hypothetical protein [Armatimonadota bacterium]